MAAQALASFLLPLLLAFGAPGCQPDSNGSDSRCVCVQQLRQKLSQSANKGSTLQQKTASKVSFSWDAIVVDKAIQYCKSQRSTKYRSFCKLYNNMDPDSVMKYSVKGLEQDEDTVSDCCWPRLSKLFS